MPPVVMLKTYFMVSMLLTIPISYLLVSWFKRNIEKRINSVNEFKEIEAKQKLVANELPFPSFVQTKSFPFQVAGFKLVNELPIILAVIISALVANYVSFPADKEFVLLRYLVFLPFVLLPLAYYIFFLLDHRRAKQIRLLILAIGTLILITIIYAFYKKTGVFEALRGLIYFYGTSSLFIVASLLFPKIREILYAVLPPVFFSLLLFFSVIDFVVAEDLARKVYVSVLYELLSIYGLEMHTSTIGFGLLFILLLLVFVLLLFVIRYAYKKKLYNNIIFLFDVIWFFHLAFTISLGERSNFIFWLVLCFILYKLVFVIMTMWLGRNSRKGNAKSLLVLRVFSLNRDSASLFSKLRSFWRYQGPINLIAGYDLTASTIDINDLLTFVSGGMKKRFNLSQSLITRNINNIDREVDINGHYRVNELYCNNLTWKTVVDSLVKKVDFVIMDIRTFSKKNYGCVHEIKELIHKVALNKMCFVIDKRTDIDFFEECIHSAWRLMPDNSPNPIQNGQNEIQVFNYADEQSLSKWLL